MDSSAIIKNYSPEVGSQWVQQLIAIYPTHTVSLSELTKIEFSSALARRVREFTLSINDFYKIRAVFLEDTKSMYKLSDINKAIIDKSIELTQNHAIRTLDAIQLSTAIIINQVYPLTFVSSDNRILAIAQQEKLPIDNPTFYT
jgi:predicted nucleic acid-binding protein